MNRGNFFIDNDIILSYEDLLSRVNEVREYFPAEKNDTVEEVFIHIIVGLLLDTEIYLLDFDFSKDEILNYDIDTSKKIEKIKFRIKSMNELIDLIQRSESKINIFTSGTTGKPKVVSHSINSFSRSTKFGEKYLDNIWGFAYNPTHMAGLQVFFQAFLNKNVIINIYDKPRNNIFSIIEKYSITHISSTPTFFRILLPSSYPLVSVKRISLGGEKSDSILYSEIQKSFPNSKINNIYASTEFGSLLISKGEFFEVPESVSQYIKINNSGLYVHCSLVGDTDADIVDDWFDTGDRVEVISEQPLQIKFLGRNSDIINIGGNKVNPREVEEVILSHEYIKLTKVYKRENSILGNILLADVVLHSNKELKEKCLRQYLNDKLQGFKIPRMIKFVESLDLTRTGKLKSDE